MGAFQERKPRYPRKKVTEVSTETVLEEEACLILFCFPGAWFSGVGSTAMKTNVCLGLCVLWEVAVGKGGGRGGDWTKLTLLISTVGGKCRRFCMTARRTGSL